MEESEVPLEHLQEQVKEKAEHSGAPWISWVALSTALLAVLAAIAGLLSGQHVNEAMMNQIEASDQWNYYQAKSIKASVLDAKMSLAGTPNESDQSKRDRYEKEQEQIKSEAEHKETAAKSNFHKHEVFAGGVTMFQIAIAIAAISALTRKRHFWIVSLLFGAVGCAFLVLAAIAR
jgi:Na+-translocating ferredoxin:NAD+ oxidoreductase RnfG subunit